MRKEPNQVWQISPEDQQDLLRVCQAQGRTTFQYLRRHMLLPVMDMDVRTLDAWLEGYEEDEYDCNGNFAR